MIFGEAGDVDSSESRKEHWSNKKGRGWLRGFKIVDILQLSWNARGMVKSNALEMWHAWNEQRKNLV